MAWLARVLPPAVSYSALLSRVSGCRCDIKPGTELTFDYGKSHADAHKLHDNIDS
jgi:hypothetical protein